MTKTILSLVYWKT